VKYVTMKQVLAWRPCQPQYSKAELTLLANGRKRISATGIAKLKIPIKDRIWALLHNEFLTDAQMHELACQFAESVLVREREAGREPDERIWAAIEIKREWLAGRASDKELAAARAAAGAAWDAAAGAAWDAARAEQIEQTLAMIEQKGTGRLP